MKLRQNVILDQAEYAQLATEPFTLYMPNGDDITIQVEKNGAAAVTPETVASLADPAPKPAAPSPAKPIEGDSGSAWNAWPCADCDYVGKNKRALGAHRRSHGEGKKKKTKRKYTRRADKEQAKKETRGAAPGKVDDKNLSPATTARSGRRARRENRLTCELLTRIRSSGGEGGALRSPRLPRKPRIGRRAKRVSSSKKAPAATGEWRTTPIRAAA